MCFLLGTKTLLRPRTLTRFYHHDGQYLVSVRYPGQWNYLQDFVQPDNPDIVDIYSKIGPDVWACLDWVCRNISYRHDIGEFWRFPSEVLQGDMSGDCEEHSFILTSLLKNFTNAYTVLGEYQGLGHAWVVDMGGEILEPTYTYARRTSDTENYNPMAMFNNAEVLELYPGALGEIFSLRRNEAIKLSLMAESIG